MTTRKGLGDKRQRHDPAYLAAKERGLAARAYFKLEEIDRRFRLIKRGARVLDLGCWPGSWMQYCVERVGEEGSIVGIDRKPVEIALPEFVVTFEGDVLALKTGSLLRRHGPFDVVLSDMAPNTTGNKDASCHSRR